MKRKYASLIAKYLRRRLNRPKQWKELPEEPDFGMTTFRDILEMEVGIRVLFPTDEPTSGPIASEAYPHDDFEADEYSPASELNDFAEPPKASIASGRTIETVMVPEGTQGRYWTVVTEQGAIQICPDYLYPLDQRDKVAVKFWLTPAVLEDLKNAAWHLDRKLANTLQYTALLILAKWELLYNKGNPFPPRPRRRQSPSP